MKNWPVMQKNSKSKQIKEAVILKYSKQRSVMGIFPYIF